MCKLWIVCMCMQKFGLQAVVVLTSAYQLLYDMAVLTQECCIQVG